MKYLLFIFTVMFMTGYLVTESWAVDVPKTNEIEELLDRVSKNIQSASQATVMAKKVNEKMVDDKMKEKEALKNRIEEMEQTQEIYAAKMIANGIDTAVVEVKLTGPAYDAYLNYVEEGGQEPFEYFRLYLWQQK